MDFAKLLKTLEGQVLDTTHIKQLEEACQQASHCSTKTEDSQGALSVSLSPTSIAVLRAAIELDNIYFYKNTLIKIMKQGKLVTEAALDELQDKGFIHLNSMSRQYGIQYQLTEKTKSLLTSVI